MGYGRRMGALHATADEGAGSKEGHDRRRQCAARATPVRRERTCPALLALPTYNWGYVSVQRIVDKVHLKQDVPTIIPPMEVVRVTKDNLGTWAPPAAGMGFHVPDRYLTLK